MCVPAFSWEAKYFQICVGVPNPQASKSHRPWRDQLSRSLTLTSPPSLSSGWSLECLPSDMPLQRDFESHHRSVSPVSVSLDADRPEVWRMASRAIELAPSQNWPNMD